MEYFTTDEFQGWYHDLDKDLRVRLDFLRLYLDEPIRLSKHRDAIGRKAGDAKTWHNIERHGKVYAVDGFIPDGVSYLEFYEAAKYCGFTGIGLYNGWSGGRGFHVDTRTDRTPDNPAIWGGIYRNNKTDYLNIWEVIGLKDA